MQKLWNSRRVYGGVAVIALAGTVGLAGCSSDSDIDNESSSAASTSASESAASSSATAGAEAAALPAVADLQSIIDRALDAAVPKEEKLDTVQEAQAAPELFDSFSQLVEQNGVVVKVTGVDEGLLPGTADAATELTIGGAQPSAATVEFVNEDGVWKVSKSFVCGQLTAINDPSIPVPAACTA